MAHAGANAVEFFVQKTASVVVAVLSSSRFEPAKINESTLNLSQAYSLLWQEKESGEVSGRKSSLEKKSMAVGAIILDLVVKGKIEIDVQPKSLLGISYERNYVKVINDCPTESYLDNALFNQLLEHHKKKPNDPRALQNVVRDALCMFNQDNNSVTASLDSLVEMGILERQKKLIGYKFPTVNPEPEENYVRHIRKIALDSAEPDSFMWTLLVLLRSADNFYVGRDPLLQRHFSKSEYKDAKERIKELVKMEN